MRPGGAGAGGSGVSPFRRALHRPRTFSAARSWDADTGLEIDPTAEEGQPAGGRGQPSRGRAARVAGTGALRGRGCGRALPGRAAPAGPDCLRRVTGGGCARSAGSAPRGVASSRGRGAAKDERKRRSRGGRNLADHIWCFLRAFYGTSEAQKRRFLLAPLPPARPGLGPAQPAGAGQGRAALRAGPGGALGRAGRRAGRCRAPLLGAVAGR